MSGNETPAVPAEEREPADEHEPADKKHDEPISIHIRPPKDLAIDFEKARKALPFRTSRASFAEALLRDALALRKRKVAP